MAEIATHNTIVRYVTSKAIKEKKQNKDDKIPLSYKFLFAGVSNIGATLFTHPLDVIKVRMQLSGMNGAAREHKNSMAAGLSIFKNEGPSGLYKGLTASVMRQASYGTTRLGLYSWLLEHFTDEKTGKPPNVFQKLGISMFAGAAGAVVGNPFDLSLVRMSSDARLPKEARRNYKNVFDAIYRIVSEEGVTALWKGSISTITRCVALNMAQLTTYSQAKEELLKTPYFEDNVYCHTSASLMSGFVATIVSTPFDVTKTRIQQQLNNEYAGLMDCLVKTAKSEGVLSLWKGTGPAYIRLAPQTLLTFVFLEAITKQYKNYIKRKEKNHG